MLSQNNQKFREGVQVPFLEKLLKENQKTLEQLENSFDDTAGKQQERLEQIEKISKAKSIITELEKAIEYSKNTEFFRHPNIPQNIPDEHIWNDAWYDEKRNAWVTLNGYFFQLPNSRTRDIQVEYEKDNVTNVGIILEEKRIQFRMGLPSILRENAKGQSVWYLLPTLYDVMLTFEIVKGKFNPETQENACLYRTGSDAYISILGDHLTEQEYTFAKEFMPAMSKMPIEVVRAMHGRPHDPKEYKKQLKQMEKETKQWGKRTNKK